jgi:hypothetical protein
MFSSRTKVGPTSGMPGRMVPAIIITAIGAFVMLTAVKALNQTFDQSEFPEALAVKVELLPMVFPLHMFTGAMALILVPLAYGLRGRSGWHRVAGRIAAADILVAGFTAFPVAWAAPVSLWSAAGFTAQACTWLALLGLAIWNIRQGRVERHRACMLMMAAATSGAVFFRVYLALWAILSGGRHFVLFYACDSWLAWSLPLAVTAFWLKQGGYKRGFPE